MPQMQEGRSTQGMGRLRTKSGGSVPKRPLPPPFAAAKGVLHSLQRPGLHGIAQLRLQRAPGVGGSLGQGNAERPSVTSLKGPGGPPSTARRRSAHLAAHAPIHFPSHAHASRQARAHSHAPTRARAQTHCREIRFKSLQPGDCMSAGRCAHPVSLTSPVPLC